MAAGVPARAEEKDEGRGIVDDLAARADVLVENFRPSSLARHGLSRAEPGRLNPRMIHCAISGYRPDTPFAKRAGYDFVLQAETGVMSITGGRTGRGRHLDIALHHSGLQFLANVAGGYLNTGDEPGRPGNVHPSIVPWQLFDTDVGEIALAFGNDAQSALGMPRSRLSEA